VTPPSPGVLAALSLTAFAAGLVDAIAGGGGLAAFSLFAWRGAILWQLALPMAVANVIGARLGARLALRRGDRFVQVVVTVVVLAVVAKLLFDMLRSAQMPANFANSWR